MKRLVTLLLALLTICALSVTAYAQPGNFSTFSEGNITVVIVIAVIAVIVVAAAIYFVVKRKKK